MCWKMCWLPKRIIPCTGVFPKPDFIPFSESNLTQFMRNAIGGNCITCAMLYVTDDDFNGSKSTLSLGRMLQNIYNYPVVNNDMMQGLVKSCFSLILFQFLLHHTIYLSYGSKIGNDFIFVGKAQISQLFSNHLTFRAPFSVVQLHGLGKIWHVCWVYQTCSTLQIGLLKNTASRVLGPAGQVFSNILSC